MSQGINLWRSKLRVKSINEEFLGLLGVAWDTRKDSFRGENKEDFITRDLVGWMKKHLKATHERWGIHSQAEVIKTNESDDSELAGRTDITISIGSRDIIYECKRLNVRTDGSRKTLATEYVTQGVNRFLTCQYAEDERVGGMLGYVMDGELSHAHKEIRSKIDQKACPKQTIDPDHPLPYHSFARFRTEHERFQSLPITLHHILIPLQSLN